MEARRDGAIFAAVQCLKQDAACYMQESGPDRVLRDVKCKDVVHGRRSALAGEREGCREVEGADTRRRVRRPVFFRDGEVDSTLVQLGTLEVIEPKKIRVEVAEVLRRDCDANKGRTEMREEARARNTV